MRLWAVVPVAVYVVVHLACVVLSNEPPTTSEPRWLREILLDTDLSISSILSQPVDKERVEFALKFLLGYQGLLERLTTAAHSRDPRVIEVFRDFEQKGGRPSFTSLLPDLSVRQDYLGWTNEQMDILRTQILNIYKLVDEFKKAVTKLLLSG